MNAKEANRKLAKPPYGDRVIPILKALPPGTNPRFAAAATLDLFSAIPWKLCRFAQSLPDDVVRLVLPKLDDEHAEAPFLQALVKADDLKQTWVRALEGVAVGPAGQADAAAAVDERQQPGGAVVGQPRRGRVGEDRRRPLGPGVAAVVRVGAADAGAARVEHHQRVALGDDRRRADVALLPRSVGDQHLDRGVGQLIDRGLLEAPDRRVAGRLGGALAGDVRGQPAAGAGHQRRLAELEHRIGAEPRLLERRVAVEGQLLERPGAGQRQILATAGAVVGEAEPAGREPEREWRESYERWSTH